MFFYRPFDFGIVCEIIIVYLTSMYTTEMGWRNTEAGVVIATIKNVEKCSRYS